MRRLAAAAWHGAYELLVGEDWRMALGVALAIALTALVADTSVPAWWTLPGAVALLLVHSVRRAVRRADEHGSPRSRPGARMQR